MSQHHHISFVSLTATLRLFDSSDTHGTVFPRASTMASDIPKKSYGYHKTATAKAVGRGAQQAHVAQEFGRISQYWDELQ